MRNGHIAAFIGLELSSQVQQQIEKDFKGSSPCKAFTRTEIDLIREEREEGRIERIQIGKFRAILADKPVGILICTAQPRRMGRREKERDIIEHSGDFSVFGKLLTPIRGNGAHQFRRKCAEKLNDAVTHISGCFLWNFQRQEHSRFSASQGKETG